MNKTILLLCFSMLSVILPAQTARITVRVQGIQQIKGNMSIAIYDNADDFPDNTQFLLGKRIAVQSEVVEYVFDDIPLGTYAIAVYHDKDMDGELNANWFGIPKEPYGFSNNVTGKMGPPDFEDASFILREDIKFNINLKE